MTAIAVKLAKGQGNEGGRERGTLDTEDIIAGTKY